MIPPHTRIGNHAEPPDSNPGLLAKLPRVPRVNLNITGKVYSLYGPRPRRSPRLIKAWVTALVLVLLLTYFFASASAPQHRDAARTAYAEMRQRYGQRE